MVIHCLDKAIMGVQFSPSLLVALAIGLPPSAGSRFIRVKE